MTIPADIHNPIMGLPEEDRHDRAKVNEAVRRYRERQARNRRDKAKRRFTPWLQPK
jgi:hypothetical protein